METTYNQNMEIATRNVEKSINLDNNLPALLDLMNIHPQCTSTASGLTDQDYPTLHNTDLIQLKSVRKVPLPAEILERFGLVQCNCMMGLFTDIKRAWLIVDSDIFMWKYEENADLSYFDGLTETIVGVSLVRPKEGVLQSFIEYLLVLITASDICVLGITFTESQNDPMFEIQVIPEPVFTLPTDGCTYSAVASTALGRIFLGSKEGNIFEIAYQAESSWFGKRCKKINHSTSALSFLLPSFLNAALTEEDAIMQIVVDNSRNILYTLSEKGSIEVYDLGENGLGFSKVTKVSQSSIVNQAVQIVKTLDSPNFRPIVSISAVEKTESAKIYLVAITQTGVRFYFTTHTLFNTSSIQQQQEQKLRRPYTLHLVHVRLPPGFSANVVKRPRDVHMAHYGDRNLLLLSTVQNKNVIWCLSSDIFCLSSNQLMEAYNTLPLDGAALALAEEKPFTKMNTYSNEMLPPMLVRQHCEPSRKFIVLTSEGVYIFVKQRPVDVLRTMLRKSRGLDTDSLRTFFAILKGEQACATCLIVAANDASDDIELAEYATRSFLVYGGEPKSLTAATRNFADQSTFMPNVISTPAGPIHHHHHGRVGSERDLSFQTAIQSSNIDFNQGYVYSNKHNGLYLYLGRILRMVWNRRCIERVMTLNNIILDSSTISAEDCRSVLQYLSALHDFLQINTQLSISTNEPPSKMENYNQLNQTAQSQDAQIEERTSLNALKTFVCHCCQVLGLWRILTEHQFHLLVSQLPENQLQSLHTTTFKELFLYGREICISLISKLVDSYLSDNASVDSISNKLREVCPLLYKAEDAAFSKANEILKTSLSTNNTDEKEEMLIQALELCKSIAPNINLPQVCRQFASLHAYHAIIDLCKTCAKKIDPDNIASHYYKSNNNLNTFTTNTTMTTEQQHQDSGRILFQKRMNIYAEILTMLDTIGGSDLIAFKNGTTDNGIGSNDGLVAQIINEILQYPDEILHVALYEWMMSKQMINNLIKVQNDSLETYLVHASKQNVENITITDLLWKYYENNGNHAASAKILDNLATKSNNLTLRQRLEYLTRAIMCMRNDQVGYAPYLGVFLRDLEDKIAVAKVQLQILNTVENSESTINDVDSVKRDLNFKLFEISQLYEEFAEPLELWECQLAIIDCAGYIDDKLIQKIWKNIFRNEIKAIKGPPNDVMLQILSKVRQISYELGTSSHGFPIDFLINELEQLSAYLHAGSDLVVKTVISLDVELEVLIKFYNKMFTNASENPIWLKEENEFHLIKAIAVLIRTFLENNDSYSSVNKRKLVSICKDTTASLLSNLYSKSNTETLINELRGLQSKLSTI